MPVIALFFVKNKPKPTGPITIVKKTRIEIAAKPEDLPPISETMESRSLFTRREMLGMTGMAGLAALTGTAASAVPQTQQAGAGKKTGQRPRVPASSATGDCQLHMPTGS